MSSRRRCVAGLLAAAALVSAGCGGPERLRTRIRMSFVVGVGWVRTMQGRREREIAALFARLRTRQRACTARPGGTRSHFDSSS